MPIRVMGLGSTMLRLENTNRNVNASADSALANGAQAIAEIATEQAPYKKGALEKSIRVLGKESGAYGTQYIVGIDLSTPSEGGKVVGDYAHLMEQGIQPGVPYGLGPGSRSKQAGTSRRVGIWFLNRAFRDLRKSIESDVESAARAAAGGRGLFGRARSIIAGLLSRFRRQP